MRILLISNMYPSNSNDFFGIFIKNIEDGLVQNGIKVDKIVIKGHKKNKLNKIYNYFNFYKQILITNFDKYDIIHLSYPSHTYLPLLFKKFKNTKLVVRLHGHDMIPITFFQKILLYFTKKAIIKSDLIVVPSNYFYKELLRIYKPKDYYIYPSGGLDTIKFYPKHKDVKINKKLIIGYVGRIERGKGVDILIKAVSKLNFDFKLIIVGSGELENDMKKLSYKLNQNKNIKFIGKIANDELINYYNQFDIFVFPTLMKESFGNVAIEAMGCKVPIIGSRIGGLTDYIYDDENGYFFDIGDINNLIEKIVQFNKLSIIDKNKMRNEAYKVALKYEKNNVTNGFINKLKYIIKEKKD